MLTIMFIFSPSCSKVRAEPKVLDSGLGKHAFPTFAQSVAGSVGQVSELLHRGAGDHDLSGDPRHDRTQTNGGLLVLAQLIAHGHEPCPLRRPRAPGLEKSRCPRIGLPWPAERVICRLLC